MFAKAFHFQECTDDYCHNIFSLLNKYLSKKLFLTASILFLIAANSFAQQKSFIDNFLERTYSIVQGDSAHPRKHYFFPVPIIAYKPETRWVLGISLTQLIRSKKFDSTTRTSAIRLNTSYSQNDQFSVRLMGEVFTNKNKFDLQGLVQYTNFVENYYGIGINQPDKYELYYFKMMAANLKGSYQIIPGLFAGVQYNLVEMYDLRYDNNSSINMESSKVTGTSPNGSLSSGAGFDLEYDDRNNIFFPTKGQDIELSNFFYNTVFGSGYNFTNLTLDARKYIGLWKENVLAVQTFFNLNTGNIPFRLMGTLGSDAYMRGYYSGIYRNNNAMAFQTELRKTIWGPLGMIAFAGFGTVSATVGDLSTNLKPCYGVGLRVMAIPKEKMNIRLDYGMGIDGMSAFYLTMAEAF